MTLASPQPGGVGKAQGHTSEVLDRGLQGPGMSFNQSSRYLPLGLLGRVSEQDQSLAGRMRILCITACLAGP